ncbi:MAG: hypothetical protein NTU93_16035 [Arthrobacter sp.]|nr:hypothetical protein [Arthrobacter sp.]
MTRGHLLAVSIVGAIAAALVPISALVILPPAQYGSFSFAYLVFAFGWSLQLSIICDSWARTRSVPSLQSGWSNYWPPVVHLSLLGGLAAGLATVAIFNDGLIGLLFSVSVALNLYRLGGRFYYSALGNRRLPVRSDATTVVTFCLTVITLKVAQIGDDLLAVSGAWALSSLAGSIFFLPGKAAPGSGLIRWYRVRKEVIHTLLGDSLLMDLGANAVPAALAPLLGAQNFGIYRGISSVATPVQLVLDPLRPTLAQLSLSAIAGRRYLFAVTGTAAVMAVGCYVVLAEIIPRIWLAASTLGAISHFALACGIFVAVNFLGHFYYIVARNHLPRRELFAGRIVQTVGAIAGPALGLVVGGLTGAVWGFVLASALSSTGWLALIQYRNHRAESAVVAV